MLAKEIERAGIPVVTITALTSIAERVGANRIFKTDGRFHHPLGNLTLGQEAERIWRTDLLRAAVRMLTLPVGGPTVKTKAELTAS
jgi:glycine/betaine/sarcosine/D-proline reductase family selenoprotein B